MTTEADTHIVFGLQDLVGGFKGTIRLEGTDSYFRPSDFGDDGEIVAIGKREDRLLVATSHCLYELRWTDRKWIAQVLERDYRVELQFQPAVKGA